MDNRINGMFIPDESASSYGLIAGYVTVPSAVLIGTVTAKP